MGKKIVKLIFLILVFIGIGSGVWITAKRENIKKEDKEKLTNIFTRTQTKTATLSNFYTYGDTLNIDGKITNISKDNFEGAKIIVTNGIEEKAISVETYIDEKNLYFSTAQINEGIELDKLELGEYYIFFRLKLNNSSVPKFYCIVPESELSDIRYYTVTNNSKNRRIDIEMLEKEVSGKTYKYLSAKVIDDQKPENVYDFVIDAGHGGKDERRTFWKIYRSRYYFRLFKRFESKT